MENQINKKILEVPVVIFVMDERTKSLAQVCFEKLGFKNIIIFDQKEGFSEKMERFFELVNSKEYKNAELFIRSDADRLVFKGIKDLIINSFNFIDNSDDGFLLSEGYGYECFMEKLRGATPHIYSRNIMNYILENKDTLIKDIQKPESHIGIHVRDTLSSFKFFNILTNLHEFEQFPSKMFNAFLNRIYRGHLSYYHLPNIFKSEYYGLPMKLAIKKANKKESNKESMTMNYTSNIPNEIINLDKKLGTIKEENLDKVYSFYLKTYNNLLETFNKELTG